MAKAKTSITTENRSGSAADAAAKEQWTEMPLSDLHPFEGHPFKVLDDELMAQTVESIKQIGVVSPLIVRPDPEGGYEILSGHRRLHAAQLAGLETVPVIVKEMDDDAAIIFMVDSNLQRENILPSERAFSYKMKLEAMKHQGERGDLTSAQVGPKSWAAQVVAEEAGDSKSQVKRYIRLTNLIPEILDMVDEKKIAFNPAVELSYLKPSEQKEFLEAIREDHPKERIVMVILPGTGGELLTEAGSRDIFEDVYDEMEADLVADGELLLHYDKSDVIETDRTRYLLGAAEVSEIDQNGNECSINLFTLERTIDYVNENLTVVSIGGELVPALRLI